MLNLADEVVIWDSNDAPPHQRTVLLWRGKSGVSADQHVSMPDLVETHSNELKQKYLAWIHDLGETCVDGQRIVDHLEIRPGFSYWWQTLLVEKCSYSASPQITDAIRLLAFEKWARDRSLSNLELVTSNAKLAECVSLWCKSKTIKFKWVKIDKEKKEIRLIRNVYNNLPGSIQALVWFFIYVFQARNLRRVGIKEWQNSCANITFISYLFNLEPNSVKDGNYKCRFWGELPERLNQNGIRTNWLHIYLKDSILPNSQMAADAVAAFNLNQLGNQTHTTLDAFLSIRVICRTLKNWAWLLLKKCTLEALNPPLISGVQLWPLFENDWKNSFVGQIAVKNILFIELMDRAVRLLPTQQSGYYLQENHVWEFALIKLWKDANHGRLVGVPHSTVRYWDLHYFFDPRSYNRKGNNLLPLPDLVAHNGPAAMESYKTASYPDHYLVGVEALRYQHLNLFETKCLALEESIRIDNHVLVLGDSIQNITKPQMTLLANAIRYLPRNTVFTLKAHPSCPIRTADYPEISMTLSSESISDLLRSCDVAYSSGFTSAAVDAYCAGIPVVSILDPNTLNLSPLRGCPGVHFVTTSEDLAMALVDIRSDRQIINIKKFFTLDQQLPRWMSLILHQTNQLY